jgi:hypothetical protein
MQESEFAGLLADLLSQFGELDSDEFEVVAVDTFAESGLLTRDEGLVVRVRATDLDTSETEDVEFQVTIKRSRLSDAWSR